jgi:hypothetical protein
LLTTKKDEIGKRKLVHLGFRVDADVLDSIRKAASRTETTVSNQTNKILRNWVTRDAYFQELGFIPMSKDILRAWINKIEERELIFQAKEFGLSAAELVGYFFGEVNVNTLIKFLEVLLSRFQSYQHHIEDKTHSFHINHDVCMNYSIFYGELLRALIEPIIKGPVDIKCRSQKMIILTFDVL